MVSAGTPIIYALLGDLIGQRTGITSLSVEGSMLCGACVGFAVAAGSGSLFLAVLCAAIAGGLIGLIQAFLSISRKSNMMATGFILIFFAQGLTTFFGRSQLGASLGKSFSLAIPVLSKIPVIGPAFFQQDILTYIAYVLPVLAWWFLTKTRTGLVLCSVGERPDVTRAYGYNPVVLPIRSGYFCRCSGWNRRGTYERDLCDELGKQHDQRTGNYCLLSGDPLLVEAAASIPCGVSVRPGTGAADILPDPRSAHFHVCDIDDALPVYIGCSGNYFDVQKAVDAGTTENYYLKKKNGGKTMKKVVAMMLVLVLLAATLVACAKPADTTQPQPEQTGDVKPGAWGQRSLALS